MTIIPELFDQDLQVLQVTVADEITLTLRATSPTAACPDCGTIATRIHSQYTRTVHDLPNRRRPIHLVLQVRRSRCMKNLGEALEVLLAHHLTISRKRKTQEVALRQASVIPQRLPAKRSS